MTLDEQYDALRTRAVWFDRGLREARLEVTGLDRVEWLHGLLTQEIKALTAGEGAYAAYLNPQGRMLSDIRVFNRGDAVLLAAEAAAREQLVSRLDQFIIMEDVALADVTSTLGCLSLAGPAASTLLAERLGVDSPELEALPEYAHMPLAEPGAFVAASRDFGVPAFDVFVPVAGIEALRQQLSGAAPAADDAVMETARIEAGRPRFGHDMQEDTIPLEAGIEHRAISFDKGCYVGQEIVIRIMHRGQGRVARRLCWVISDPSVAREEAEAWTAGQEVRLGEKAAGKVTSACWSPQRSAWLGIAMLHRDATEPGTVVQVAGSPARVERLP